MTLLSRSCFEPSDIQAIQLECKCNNCSTVISFKPEKWQPRTLKCPSCGEILITMAVGGQQSPEFLAVDALINALKTFRAANAFNFTLRLEFDRVQS
jgi:hypothetical protein